MRDDAGGDAREVAHDGEHENPHRAVSRAQLRHLRFFPELPGPAAVRMNSGRPAQRAPRHDRCDHGADGARDDNPVTPERDFGRLCAKVRGGGNDHFARQRQDGAFGGHQKRDERVAAS